MTDLLKGLLIRPDGTTEHVEQRASERPLDFMYRTIGASPVTVLTARDDLDIWLDDEGLLREEVVLNAPAAAIYAVAAQIDGDEMPVLAGNALVLGGTDDEGDTRSLSPTEAEWIERALYLGRSLLT